MAPPAGSSPTGRFGQEVPVPFIEDQLQLRTDGPVLFVLLADLVYVGRDERFVVPKGLVTDLATVPAALTWLAPRYGIYTRAAVLHDWLTEESRAGRFRRVDADGVFRRVLRELGVSLPRRWMMWAAVRVASRLSGATPGDLARWLLVAVLAVPFAAPPTILVQLWLWVFALADQIGRGRDAMRAGLDRRS